MFRCAAPSDYAESAGDCDDRDDLAFPEADELCDGRDQDCDGLVDEGVSNRCGGCGATPSEVCGDFLDNDCDGAVDEAEDGCFCDGRTSQPCYPADPDTLGIGVCRGGLSDCACLGGARFCDDGVVGACEGAIVPSEELCNGLDDDCDGAVDEGLRSACGECGATPAEVCNGLDDDCDGAVDEGVTLACGVCPGEEADTEACDGFDNDCDGAVDEGCDCAPGGASCYPGPPATVDVGLCRAGVRSCYEGADSVGFCDGYVLPSLEICNGEDDDCDGRVDVDANDCSVCGTSEEVCDGLDNDCDGLIDEGLLNACGDCLDSVTPEEDGGLDACDGVDNDCDGLIDEGLLNACGTCDESCYTDEFDDDEFESATGDGISADDGLRLDSSSFIYQDLWVANTGDETVTRINTETNEVVGTYDVSVNPHPDRNDDDPSRTAVDFDGNAWVANRAFDERGSVVKIRGGDCVTDCVIFRVPIGAVTTSRADSRSTRAGTRGWARTTDRRSTRSAAGAVRSSASGTSASRSTGWPWTSSGSSG